ncbi:MAG: hypothetical protein Q9M25_06090 [Mariprofundaceae bacterium]|nr:hypothetical protein [Mariprofundaceae bacterium]
MSELNSQHNFSIQRHAVQQLLRLALDAAPAPISGLLGGHDDSVAYLLPLGGKHAVDVALATLKDWQQQGISLLAVYASDTDAATAQSPLPVDLLNFPGITQLPLLNIRTDTKGRIEAELRGGNRADGAGEIWPLQMQEDGGLYPFTDNG